MKILLTSITLFAVAALHAANPARPPHAISNSELRVNTAGRHDQLHVGLPGS